MKSHVSFSCYVVLFINAVFQVQLLFFFSRQALAEGNFKSSFVNTKTAKEGGGHQFEGSLVVFRKICLLKREWDPVFDIIISLIFPENLIEISQVVQKIWRISLTIIDIFIYFHRFFGLFDIPLLQRNWWRQFITDYVSIFLLPTYFK